MKNRLAFAALTFAFTIAGACVGRAAMSAADLTISVLLVALVGAGAAALSGEEFK